jgi:hypothetical protein
MYSLSLLISTSVDQGFIQEGCREPKRALITLNPSQMISKGQKICDFSGATRLRFSFLGKNYPVPAYPHKFKRKPVFPENSRGVLYYHSDSDLPSIAGEVRFRLCDTVENFDRGSDLHILGTPWSLSLPRIAYTPAFMGLRELLVKEGLVDDQTMTDLSSLPHIDRLDDRSMIFYPSQPFHLDLSIHELILHLVTRNAVQYVRFPNLFTERQSGQSLQLYNGKSHITLNVTHNLFAEQLGIMRARFELSNLPEHRTSGPTLVLRFLDCLTKLEPQLPGYEAHMVYPRPGHLFQKRPRLYSQPKVWSYPLNKRRYGAVLKDFFAITGQSFRSLNVSLSHL